MRCERGLAPAGRKPGLPMETMKQLTVAFEPLMREHQSRLRAFIRSLGVDDAWVDDVAQEAFLIAYRRMADFQAEADFGKWIRGIARNLVANELRKKGRRSRLLHDSLAEVLWKCQPESLETASNDLLPVLEECVGRLPAHSQELLQRRYASGENACDLARELRLSADAVRQHLLRIRVAVKRCVEKKLREAWL